MTPEPTNGPTQKEVAIAKVCTGSMVACAAVLGAIATSRLPCSKTLGFIGITAAVKAASDVVDDLAATHTTPKPR